MYRTEIEYIAQVDKRGLSIYRKRIFILGLKVAEITFLL